MRKWIIFLLPIVLLLASCEFSENFYNYPKSVDFPAEGGLKVISGDVTFSAFEIRDEEYNRVASICDLNDTINGNYDSAVGSFDWLTVNSRNKTFVIKADPNTTGEKRKLTITGWYGPKYADIVVRQNK